MPTTKINAYDRRMAYDRFIEKLALALDKDFDLIAKVADAAFDYLDHIPAEAYPGMEQIAVNSWARWPMNFPKAVKEAYETWRHENKHSARPAGTFCEYCNGVGFFTGIKRVAVKPGVSMPYPYTFRCGACRNWFGVLGEAIPSAWPLEAKTQGFEIEKYPAAHQPEPKTSPAPVNPAARHTEYLPYRD